MCARCGESLKKIGRVSKTEHQNKLTILLFNVWNHEKSINCLWYAEQKVFNFSLCLCVAAFSLSRCLNFQLDNFGCCWNGTFNHQIDFSWTKPDKFSSTHPLSLSLVDSCEGKVLVAALSKQSKWMKQNVLFILSVASIFGENPNACIHRYTLTGFRALDSMSHGNNAINKRCVRHYIWTKFPK